MRGWIKAIANDRAKAIQKFKENSIQCPNDRTFNLRELKIKIGEDKSDYHQQTIEMEYVKMARCCTQRI